MGAAVGAGRGGAAWFDPWEAVDRMDEGLEAFIDQPPCDPWPDPILPDPLEVPPLAIDASTPTMNYDAIWQKHPDPDEFLKYVGGEQAKRSGAMAWLGSCPHKSTVSVLVARAKQEKMLPVAAAAVRALGQRPIAELNPGSLEALPPNSSHNLHALQQHRSEPGANQIESLQCLLLQKPEARLERSSAAERYTLFVAVAELLAHVGMWGEGVLLSALTKAPTQPQQVAAAIGLTTVNPPPLKALEGHLKPCRGRLAELVAWILACHQSDEAHRLLDRAVQASSSRIRRLVAWRWWLNPKDTRLAARIHRKSPEQDEVIRWLAAMSAMRSDEYIMALIRLLDCEHPALRRVAEATMVLVERVAVLPLRSQTSAARPEPEDLAISGWLGSNLEHLESVCQNAVKTSRSVPCRVYAIHGLTAVGTLEAGRRKELMLPLLQCLYDRQPLVRHAAAQTIGSLFPGTLRPYLEEIAWRDPIKFVQEAAEEVLEQAG